MQPKSIYLAGPEVFHVQARDIGVKKRNICQKLGFEGLYPLDNEVADGLTGAALAAEILRLNLDCIHRADFVIANLTPFRGPSADSGTVFEVAYAIALRKTVIGYCNIPGSYLERCQSAGLKCVADGDRWVDHDGLAVENFGLEDNLMIAAVLRQTPHTLIIGHAIPEESAADRIARLDVFELCVQQLASAVSPASLPAAPSLRRAS